LAQDGGLAFLRGNLARDGAVIKHLAASSDLPSHTGPAVVFEDYRDMQSRVNDPELEVTDDELRRRKLARTPPPKIFERGYGALYTQRTSQADQGCDCDFLARSGVAVEPNAG